MTKRICTVSIFIVLLAVLATSIVIQVPDYVWWAGLPRIGSFPLFAWVAMNILAPMMILIAVVGLLILFWKAADTICSSLRKKVGRG